MSLEEEAMKQRPPLPQVSKPARTFDRPVRIVAAILLLLLLTVIFWIPFQLLGAFASALVLAALTMLGASLASRLYQLRIRVESLEAVLRDEASAPPKEPAPATPSTSPAPDAGSNGPSRLLPTAPELREDQK